VPGPTSRPRRWPLQAAAIALGLLPLAKIVADGLAGRLGANPIELVQDRLGFWTLTFLALSLVPTPAHDLLGLAWPVRVRRTVGLLAFSYASLHLVWYVGIDQVGDVGLLVKDVTKRKFMTVGFVAWLALLPLAVTSTSRWVRRLGYVRWKRLHRLVYAAALLGVVHFIWRVKADLRRPIWFAVAIGVLLALRLVPRRRTARAAGSVRPASS
jgi:sulfoxide reductase heme-binding subunit YedZ